MTKTMCARCAGTFPRIFSNHSGMGRGCAAEVTCGEIAGHYGSVFDLDILTPLAPLGIADGSLVCDHCLHEMLSQKQLLLNGAHAGKEYLKAIAGILAGGPLNP